MDNVYTQAQPIAVRWWIYFQERFPLPGNGVLIAFFSAAAVCYSSILRGAGRPTGISVALAFGSSFFLFLLLRIADEFKDAEEDARYRPYRPVPRGLVSLSELGVLGVFSVVILIAIGLYAGGIMLIPLGATMLYFALMSKEFFVAEWLKSKHILYMVSHMFIMPFIDFYATAMDWGSTGHPPTGLWTFIVLSFFNGFVVEVGRKIRNDSEEEEGVETYSMLWGRKRAVWTWILCMAVTLVVGVMASRIIGFTIPTMAVLLPLLLVCIWTGSRFAKAPESIKGKTLEKLSGLWTLCLYGIVGIAPVAWSLLSNWGSA